VSKKPLYFLRFCFSPADGGGELSFRRCTAAGSRRSAAGEEWRSPIGKKENTCRERNEARKRKEKAGAGARLTSSG